jgi:hypothetical protein
MRVYIQYIVIKNRANLGYDLLPSKWNRGYMTDALRLFLELCFEEWNFSPHSSTRTSRKWFINQATFEDRLQEGRIIERL